jgi:hypothetical protein
MIYIETDIYGNVVYQNYVPFHAVYGMGKTQEELLQTGYLVDEIPKEDYVPGKVAVLKFNKETLGAYYEYKDIEKTKEEIQAVEIEDLKVSILNMQDAVNMLLGL